jgi:hypothetical protein
VEVCTSVGLDPSTPLEQCMDVVKADIAKDGIAAPAADVPGLTNVIANAREGGIDLKVVVMEKSPAIDTPLRDIATAIGSPDPDSVVLVLSPGWAGTYSGRYDRVILEAGQDVAKTSATPVQGAQAFVDQLKTPDFPWTAFTLVLVVAVAVATVLARILQVRAQHDTSPKKPSDLQ